MEVSRILREKLNRYIHLGGTDTTSDLSIITINAGLRLISAGGPLFETGEHSSNWLLGDWLWWKEIICVSCWDLLVIMEYNFAPVQPTGGGEKQAS